MNKKRKKLLLLLLVFVMFLPNVVQGHEVYYLQTLIDDMSIQYKAFLIKDEAKLEGSHLEYKETGPLAFSGIGTFSSSRNFFTSYQMGKSDYENIDNLTNSNSDGLVFSFPPKVAKNETGATIHANGKHVDRAFEIKSVLIPQLNEALKKINGDKNFKTAEDLIKASQALLSNQVKGWSITYSDTPDKDTGFYMVKLKNNDTNEIFEYQYAVQKGYTDPKSPLYNEAYTSKEADIMTWHQLVAHANYFYLAKNDPLYVSNFAYANKTSIIGEFFSDIVRSILDGLRDVLEIFSIEDLVYNRGLRSLSNVYYKGALTNEAYSSTRLFYVISLCIALSLLMSSVIYLLFKKTWSTMNTRSRVDLMEGLQNILITAFMLGLTYVFASVLLDINVKIVSIFSSIQGEQELFTSANSFSSAIGGILMNLFYFFVCCYVNFVYIMRSMWLIILLGTGPLWIVGLAFGDKGKTYTKLWFKHLIMNVFLQSFHAIFLTIFHNALSGMRGIEAFVICFSLISLTKFFKSLILGDDGDLGGSAMPALANVGANYASSIMPSKNGNTYKTSTKNEDVKSNDNETSNSGSNENNTKKHRNYSSNNNDSKNNGNAKETNISLQNIAPNENYNQLKNEFSTLESEKPNVFKKALSGVKETASDLKDTFNETMEEFPRTNFARGVIVKAGKKVAQATVENKGAISRGVLRTTQNTAAALTGAGMMLATGGRSGSQLFNKGIVGLTENAKNTSKVAIQGTGRILGDSIKDQKENNNNNLLDKSLKDLPSNSFSISQPYGENGSIEYSKNEALYSHKGISSIQQDGENLSVDVDLSGLKENSEDYLNYNAIRDIYNASNYEELKEAVGSHSEKVALFRGETSNFAEQYKTHKLETLDKSYDHSPKTNLQEQNYFDNYKKNYLESVGISKVNVVSNKDGDITKDLMQISYNKEGQKEMGIANIVRNDNRTSVTRNDSNSSNKYSYNILEKNNNLGKISYQSKPNNQPKINVSK